MKRLFAAMILAPSIALAGGNHHAPPPPPPAPAPAPTPPPKPTPPPAPAPAPRSGGDNGGLIVGLAAAGLIGLAIYHSKNDKGEEKRVDVTPTADGRGAMLTFTSRQ